MLLVILNTAISCRCQHLEHAWKKTDASYWNIKKHYSVTDVDWTTIGYLNFIILVTKIKTYLNLLITDTPGGVSKMK